MTMFKERGGKVSLTRVMSFIALVQAMFYTVFQTIADNPIQWEILTIWLSAGFGGKVAQKFAEREK
jgi:hypothetical protein